MPGQREGSSSRHAAPPAGQEGSRGQTRSQWAAEGGPSEGDRQLRPPTRSSHPRPSGIQMAESAPRGDAPPRRGPTRPNPPSGRRRAGRGSPAGTSGPRETSGRTELADAGRDTRRRGRPPWAVGTAGRAGDLRASGQFSLRGQRLTGKQNSSKAGFTNVMYCDRICSSSRPRSLMSLSTAGERRQDGPSGRGDLTAGQRGRGRTAPGLVRLRGEGAARTPPAPPRPRPRTCVPARRPGTPAAVPALSLWLPPHSGPCRRGQGAEVQPWSDVPVQLML